MKLSNQSNAEDRAVSPVIGVILMVAITVILAAVIGTFVLGLGDQLGDTAPQASFTVDSADTSAINVTKTGGQSIESDDLTLAINGTRVESSSFAPSGTWQTGSSKGVDLTGESITSGEQVVRIIHDPSGNAIFEQTVDF